MKENKKENKVLYIIYYIIVIAVIIAIFVTSFAIYNYSKKGITKNSLVTGTLKLTLKNEVGLNLVSSYPISDNSAMNLDAYTFTIENTGDIAAKARIYILDDTSEYQNDNCTDNKIDWEDLKYSLKKGNSVVASGELPSDGIIYTDAIPATTGNVVNYELRVWINSEAGNEVEGRHFHGKIRIKAITSDSNNFDTGA